MSQKWDRRAGKHEPVAHLLPGFELSCPRLSYKRDQLYVRDATLEKLIPVQRCRLYGVAVAWHVEVQQKRQVEEAREKVREKKQRETAGVPRGVDRLEVEVVAVLTKRQAEKAREEVRKSKYGGGAKRSGDNRIAGGVRSGGIERQGSDTNGDHKRRRYGSGAGCGGVGHGTGQ